MMRISYRSFLAIATWSTGACAGEENAEHNASVLDAEVGGPARDARVDVDASPARNELDAASDSAGLGDACASKAHAACSSLAACEAWQRRDDLGGDEYGRAVAVDPAGDVLVVGSAVQGTAGVALGNRILIYRHDAKGDLLWTRTFDSAGNDFAYGVGLDAASNAIVVGDTEVDGLTAAWLGKYSAAGELLWSTATPNAAGLHESAVDVAVSRTLPSSSSSSKPKLVTTSARARSSP
jgi:hypothetical protein